MFENKKALLLIIIIFIIVTILVFNNNTKNNNNYSSNIDKNLSYEEKSLTSSELKENLKDFYNVSITKNQKKPIKKVKDYMEKINKLLALFNQKNIKISELDNLIIDFLKDSNISRIDKINSLWSMISEIDISSNKGMYLLEYLSSLHPIELTDEMMLTYKEQEKTDVKLAIMDVLTDSLDIANPDVQNEEELNFIANKTEEIQSLLYNEVLNNTDSDIFSQALTLYSNISSPEQAQEIITSIINGEGNIQVEDKELIPYLAEIAIATEESQESILPEILNSAENTSINKNILNETIFDILNDKSASEIFTTESKNQLSEFLDKKEPKLTTSEDTSMEHLENYYSWVNAKSKLGDVESNKFIEDVIVNSDNPLKISSIILYSDNDLVENIKKHSEANRINDILSSSLEDSNVKNESKIIIEDALATLNQNI